MKEERGRLGRVSAMSVHSWLIIITFGVTAVALITSAVAKSLHSQIYKLQLFMVLPP